MKRVAISCLVLALVGSLLPGVSLAAPQRVTHSDPDDTAGKLDIESVRWRVKSTPSGNRFVHEMRTYERWDHSEFYLWFYLYEEDPDFSDCYPDRCSGLWEGEIYWDDESEQFISYVVEDQVDSEDRQTFYPRVRKKDEKTLVFSLPEKMFYPDSHRYEAEFQTFWMDALRVGTNLDCRIDYCVDKLPDTGTVSFPIVRSRG